jgi:hypothetical protein
MIDPDVEPMFNVSPYRRIDPMHPGRKARISLEEAMRTVMEGGKEPDLGLYFFNGSDYILKETMP